MSDPAEPNHAPAVKEFLRRTENAAAGISGIRNEINAAVDAVAAGPPNRLRSGTDAWLAALRAFAGVARRHGVGGRLGSGGPRPGGDGLDLMAYQTAAGMVEEMFRGGPMGLRLVRMVDDLLCRRSFLSQRVLEVWDGEFRAELLAEWEASIRAGPLGEVVRRKLSGLASLGVSPESILAAGSVELNTFVRSLMGQLEREPDRVPGSIPPVAEDDVQDDGCSAVCDRLPSMTVCVGLFPAAPARPSTPGLPLPAAGRSAGPLTDVAVAAAVRGPNPPPATATPTAPPDEFLSSAGLARALGVRGTVVDAALRNITQRRSDCRTAVTNPRKGEARYLYRVADVWPELVLRLPAWRGAAAD